MRERARGKKLATQNQHRESHAVDDAAVAERADRQQEHRRVSGSNAPAMRPSGS